MYSGFYNSASLSNAYNNNHNFQNNNQTVRWERILIPPTNASRATIEDTTIKFVLKNNSNKLQKPITVFSVPIIDKTKKEQQSVVSKKHKDETEFEDENYNDEYDESSRHKKGQKQKNKSKRGCLRRRKVGHKFKKIKKLGKYIVPAMIGFLSFKMILVPVLLKALALMSAKGVFLGMVSFIMASLLSLKQIVGSTGRHSDKRSDITFIPISIRKTGQKDEHNKNDGFYEHEYHHENLPYNYYDEPPS